MVSLPQLPRGETREDGRTLRSRQRPQSVRPQFTMLKIPKLEFVHSRCWVVVSLIFVALLNSSSATFAQSGFLQLHGKYIDITTDLPDSRALEQLPAAFDTAAEQWLKLFNADPHQLANRKATAYLMQDASRFRSAGFLTSAVPVFREGYQFHDSIFCNAQSSEYYQRHLLLHEGWHWFVSNTLGNYGPTWWMEGTAEWQATHDWDGENLRNAIVPRSRESSAYWGRLLTIKTDLNNDQAPSLPTILNAVDKLPSIESTYAWSWAAIDFFANHPRYQGEFNKLLLRPITSNANINREVLGWIGEDLGLVQSEFNGFVSELDYGVEAASVIVDLKADESELPQNGKLAVQAGLGWQALLITKSERAIELHATGRCVLQSSPYRFESEPQGITLRYVKGRPMGMLLGSVVPRKAALDQTRRWTSIGVGPAAKVSLPSASILLLRVNDDNRELADNRGAYMLSFE